MIMCRNVNGIAVYALISHNLSRHWTTQLQTLEQFPGN